MHAFVNQLRFGAALGSLRALEFANRGMDDRERRWLAQKLLAHRPRQETRPLLRLLSHCVRSGKNFNYDIHENGEAALLQRLAPLGPRVVFDVGANVGDWSLAARRLMPEVSLHAFEIVPQTGEELRRRIDGVDVTVNAIGLADRTGEVEVFMHAASTERASIVEAAARVGPNKLEPSGCFSIQARVETGDAYMREAGLARIDLLKIDVEGAELAVLRGFSNAFDLRAIDVVQFEYGAANLITRDFLQDFYIFLQERGFVLGKVFPEDVAFGPYSYDLEDFLGPIFVACRKERADIIAAIGGIRP